MPFSFSNALRTHLVDLSNCPWSFPFHFLRMLWCVLSLGHSLFYLRFLTGPWIFVSSDMTFEYLLFTSFPNVSHSFTSIHKTWTCLNLFFRFSTILRMLGWVCESHFKMLYVVLPTILLTSSFFWWQLPSYLVTLILIHENVFIFVVCTIYGVYGSD